MRMIIPLLNDRAATLRELRRARSFVLSSEGPGIVRAAEHLGIAPGYLSQLLQGKRTRRLLLSELRQLRTLQPNTGSAPATDPAAGVFRRRRARRRHHA